MNRLLIKNARLILPDAVWNHGWLLAEGGTIRHLMFGDAPDLADARVIDAAGRTLLPGFVDVHVHGAAGHDMMECSPDGLREQARFYARHGVTGFLPTTHTAPRAPIQNALEAVLELRGPQPDGATILGAHLEGPYIDTGKKGAQREEGVRRADRDEALAFLDVGVIRLLALAPEHPENHWLIRECVARGITVSAAHTSGSYAQVAAAIRMGVSHATHTYNAMTPLNHREPGALGALLTHDEVRCELIADNIHVHPAAMKLLYRAKGADGVILVTDAVRSAGLPDGEYVDDNRTILVRDGAVRLEDGTLAGSTLTMDRALRNFIAATGETLETLWPASSLNAARALHLAHRKGSLEAGKDADLVLVDDDVEVYLTVAEGRVVYERAR